MEAPQALNQVFSERERERERERGSQVVTTLVVRHTMLEEKGYGQSVSRPETVQWASDNLRVPTSALSA